VSLLQWCRCKYVSSGMRCLSCSKSSPMAAILLPSPNYKLGAPVPRQGWWGGNKISLLSEAERPEDLQKGKQGPPGQSQGTALDRLAAGQPLPQDFQGRSQKGKWSRGIQAMEPAAQSGRVRDSIRIFEVRRRPFPRTIGPESIVATPDCVRSDCSGSRAGRKQEGT
jgi:hypothetical protein